MREAAVGWNGLPTAGRLVPRIDQLCRSSHSTTRRQEVPPCEVSPMRVARSLQLVAPSAGRGCGRVRGRAGGNAVKNVRRLAWRNQTTTPVPRKDEVVGPAAEMSINANVKKHGDAPTPLHRRLDHARLGRQRERGLAEVLRQAPCREPGHRRRPDAARSVAARSRQPRRHSSQAGRADDRHE